MKPPKARMLYYDDARHANLYVVEPDGGDVNTLDVLHPVDVVANSCVDTFVFGLGIGATMSYGTEVGELWFAPEQLASEGENDIMLVKNAINWRGRQSVQALLDQGRDPLSMLVERAHHRRMTFIASLRLSANNVTGQTVKHGDPISPSRQEGKLETSAPRSRLDFMAAAAREERMALLREALTKYQVDGLELDIDMGGGLLFESENVEAGMPVLTGFIAEVRSMVDAEALRRGGRPVSLGLRVLPTVRGSLLMGMDIEAILGAGLVDHIVPIFYVSGYVHAFM